MNIKVEYEKPNFVFSFHYEKRLLDLVRSLPVREYDKSRKTWLVPELAIHTVNDQIEDSILEWSDEASNRKEIIIRAIEKLVDYKFNDGQEISSNANNKLVSELRPYQKAGVNYLKHAKRAILADDMGLGKTIQSLQAVIDLDLDTNLVLCPATLKWKWHNEFKKHFNIEASVIEGGAKARAEKWNGGSKFVIANYDLLLRDWNSMPKKWGSIIADECVYLKNPAAKRTKLAKKLNSNIKIGLSGWPLENNLLEFHSIMSWVRPEILPSAYKFKYRYINFNWDGKIASYKNLNELHALTSHFILRRTKDNVLKELPPKIYTEFPLDLGTKAKKAYKEIADGFISWLENESNEVSTVSILEQLTRLRQFVEFPQSIDFDIDSIKLEWLDDIYSNTDKVVVFCGFRDSVKRISEKFDNCYVLTGATKHEERFDLIERFNNDSKAVLAMTDAGKFGLDVVGASTIVHFGYSYNPATIAQREDRLHRLGQKSTVNVLMPYINSTIDEGIRNVFLKREAQAKDFLEGSEQMSASINLSRKEFMKLVKGG